MPPPRQNKIVERDYGVYKILRCYGSKAVRSIVKILCGSVFATEQDRKIKGVDNTYPSSGTKHHLLPHIGEGISNYNLTKDENQTSHQPSPVGKGVSNSHTELVSGSRRIQKFRGQSSVYKMLKQVQHDGNFPKRTYSLINLFTYSPRELTAFTLAEVLITLGIIGIVAAMTMPALISHHKKIETSARLKKFYSSMEQAIRLSEIDNGDSREWIKASTQKDEEGNSDYEANGKASKEFFMTYLAPYFKYIKITEGENFTDENGEQTGNGTQGTVYLADGSSFRFNNGSCMDFIFDANGNAKPNVVGRDTFVFYMCFSDSTRKSVCGNGNKAFCTKRQVYNNRTELINACKTNAYYCSALLEHDNWEFKDDYPRRL